MIACAPLGTSASRVAKLPSSDPATLPDASPSAYQHIHSERLSACDVLAPLNVDVAEFRVGPTWCDGALR